MTHHLLNADNTALILVDIQEKLIRVMHDKDSLIDNLQKLIKGAKVLGIPIISTEQYPEGLGKTIPEVSGLLSGEGVPKLCFSCCGDETFMARFSELKRKQVLIAGIEAHVCVFQTAMDLLNAGYEVQVVADAVDSRTEENKNIALERLRSAGATITSTEIALFELLKDARSDKFREISRIVK